MRKTKQEKFKEIAREGLDYRAMIWFGKLPEIGEYLITGLQMGNHNGEKGWHKYIGYVVQIRKGIGAFGSDMILLRHPDGSLTPHENQSYFRMNEYWENKAKKLFKKGVTPSIEDYTQPYTIGGKYPAIGKIIENSVAHPEPDNSPLMKITSTNKNGDTTIEVC
ncbi:MAG: hypothetical protein ABFD15_06030 [Methanofastidiosum sp.]